MKNQTQDTKAYLRKLTLPAGSYSNVTLRTISYDKVASGPMIHGDHEAPNPWSYDVTYNVPHNSRGFTNMQKRAGGYQGKLGIIDAQYDGPLANCQPPLPTNTGSDAAYSKALGDLNDGMRGSLDIAVDLAESKQAFNMIKGVKAAERWFSRIGVKRWANEWLELQYGWKPLAHSIYGAANELLEHAEDLSHVRGRGVIRDSSNGYRSIASLDATGAGNYCYGPVDVQYSRNVKNACLIDITVGPPSSAQLSTRWTSLNPVSIAWELVPYSFVIDWFIDVGSYLKDTETAFLFNSIFKSGFQSNLWHYKIDEKIDYNKMNQYFVNTSYIVYIQSRCAYERVTFTRNLLYDYPLPALPRVNTDLSWSRLVSAAALLVQKIPKRDAMRYAPTLSRLL